MSLNEGVSMQSASRQQKQHIENKWMKKKRQENRNEWMNACINEWMKQVKSTALLIDQEKYDCVCVCV